MRDVARIDLVAPIQITALKRRLLAEIGHAMRAKAILASDWAMIKTS